MNLLLPLMIALPLAGAIITMFLPGGGPAQSKQARSIATIFTVLPLLLVATVYSGFDRTATTLQYAFHQDWITVPNVYLDAPLKIGFDLGVDGLSMPLLLLTSVISVLAVIGSKQIHHRVKEYFIWFLLLVTGLYGVFIAQDLFLFFLFLELTLIPMYFLIHIWGGEKRQRTATQFLIYRGIASVGILISFVGLALAAATVSGQMTMNVQTISEIVRKATPQQISTSLRYGLFIVLFVAVLIEEAFFPFHTWLPATHEQANTGVSMLVGGVLMKIGAYVLLRMGVGILPDAVHHFSTMIAVFGVLSIVYGGWLAIVQKDWRRLVAFSAISHMGVMLLGVAAMNPAGLQGALFMTVSSGLLSGLLFYLLGAMQERTHTLEISKLGGLSKSMPILSGFLLVAALGSLGLPGTSGFVSEILSFTGSFMLFPKLSAVGTAGIILAAVYLLWAIQRTTFGPIQAIHDHPPEQLDVRSLEYVPSVVLTALVIMLGLFPSLIGNLFNPTITQLLSRMGG